MGGPGGSAAIGRVSSMMQATPPTMNAAAAALMASKGYKYSYNGVWVFTTKDNRNVVHITPWNFMPRFGVVYNLGGDQVVRFAYGRYIRNFSTVRETLGDYVNQYTGYAQTTSTVGLTNGVPQQTLANPYPANNPVIEPYGQSYGVYTGVGGPVSLDQYDQRPQINDRFNISYQQRIWLGIVTDISYFFNLASEIIKISNNSTRRKTNVGHPPIQGSPSTKVERNTNRIINVHKRNIQHRILNSQDHPPVAVNPTTIGHVKHIPTLLPLQQV